jgi:Transglutaminase-like superfamily
MMTHEEIRDFYRRAGSMTAFPPGAELENLPREIAALCQTVQGLLLHEHWAPAYHETLSPRRRAESQIRPVREMIARMTDHDQRPLAQPRPPGKRVVGVCRHFTVFTVAALRAQGVPARARCGFASYFTPGNFEDHWVAEYWNDAERRWVLVDAQIDAVQKRKVKPDFDLLDVPRHRFVVAGDAWSRWRSGTEDAMKFGIFDFRGAWFIANNVLRDFAALNNVEMLPWDLWGPMAREDEELDRPLFDRLAELTLDADRRFGEIRALYDADERLRVPATVFNAVLNRPDPV